jgi:hypothetical protein
LENKLIANEEYILFKNNEKETIETEKEKEIETVKKELS